MQLFYAPDVDFSTGRYLLSGEESRHCARVLRLRSGDFVHITDGRGTLCRAEIVSVSPHGCELSLGERTENFEKRSYFLQVAVAPTKNMDRLEWFVEKATEIGIDRITPLLTDHCERRTVKTDRLIRVVTGAVKQSLKAWHPQVDELMEIVIEKKVPVVTTGAGNPGKYIPAWKEKGIKVMPVVAAAVLAKRLERYGIDGIIAEGCESGGHIGELTTMALVPQVVDAVSVPVIAAGGIADGRQLTAAFALGACGVQVGTCLLASEECPIHVNYKQAVLKAGANDTTVTGRSTGAPVRVLKNKMAREYLRMEKKDVPLEEMEQLTLGSLRKAVFDGDVDGGSFMAGQVAGMVHELRPLRQIFEELMAGYAAVRKGLSE